MNMPSAVVSFSTGTAACPSGFEALALFFAFFAAPAPVRSSSPSPTPSNDASAAAALDAAGADVIALPLDFLERRGTAATADSVVASASIEAAASVLATASSLTVEGANVADYTVHVSE